MKKILVMATCMVLLLAGAAQAETIQFTGVAPAEVVSINGVYHGSVWAGMYNFNILGSGPFAGPYKGFCVDPQTETPSFSATITAVTDGSNYEAAAYLMDRYYGVTRVNNQKAAQVQLAIWELVWDFNPSGSYNLTSGNFYLPTSSTYKSAVQALIDETKIAGVLDGFTPSGYYITASDSSQDWMFHKVPEAGALLLFGTGLVGLVGYRRVRRMQ